MDNLALETRKTKDNGHRKTWYTESWGTIHKFARRQESLVTMANVVELRYSLGHDFKAR